VVINERDLDISTAGNLDQLRTGYFYHDAKAKQWMFKSCRTDLEGCGIRSAAEKRNHISVSDFDPISFIRTDANFIKDHNDVFSCYAQAYITTIMFETQVVDRNYVDLHLESSEQSRTIANCNYKDFDFGRCFNNQLYDYNCATIK
jgi:hypothetical protein